MIYISKNDPAVTIEAARSSGAGGQKVNKTSSKAVLKIDILSCKGLTDEQKDVLLGVKKLKLGDTAQSMLRKLQNIISENGVLITQNQEARTLHQNIDNVITKLNEALTLVLTPEKERAEGLTKEAKAKMKAKGRLEQTRRYKERKSNPRFDLGNR